MATPTVGTAKIVSVVGSGEYTITQIFLDTDTGLASTTLFGVENIQAFDITALATRLVDDKVQFIMQETTDGFTKAIISDLAGGLPPTAGKSRYMVLQLDASLEPIWDWVRAHG